MVSTRSQSRGETKPSSADAAATWTDYRNILLLTFGSFAALGLWGGVLMKYDQDQLSVSAYVLYRLHTVSAHTYDKTDL